MHGKSKDDRQGSSLMHCAVFIIEESIQNSLSLLVVGSLGCPEKVM